MNRSRWSHRHVFLLCAAALGVLLAGILIVRLRDLTRNLDRLLVRQIEAQISREVRSGPVTVTRSGRFTIRDFRIAGGRTFRDGALLSVDRVTGRIDLISLLFHRDRPLDAIRRIDLHRPVLSLLRDAGGRWNFEDLLRARGPAQSPALFRGVIRIDGGEVIATDHRARLPASRLPAVNRLTGLNGTVVGNGIGPIDFRLSGAGAPAAAIRAGRRAEPSRFGGVAASGSYSPSARSGNLRFDLRFLDAAYWLDYAAPPSPIYRVHAGRANLSGSLGIAEGRVDPSTINAIADLSGGTLALAALDSPLRGIALRARARGDSLQANGTANLENIPVVLDGRVRDFRRPVVDARISTGLFRIERLPDLVAAVRPGQWPPISGQVGVTARITGPARSPRIDLRAESPRLTHPRAGASGLSARATIENGLLRGTAAASRLLSGTMSANGSIRLSGSRHPWNLAGRFDGIDAGAAAPSGLPLAGRASGTFRFSGADAFPRGGGIALSGNASLQMASGAAGPFRFASGSATAATADGRSWTVRAFMARGSVQRFNFRSLVADATVDATGARIRSARADAWRGRLTADGTVTRAGRLDLRVAADNVALKELMDPLGQSGITGAADFTGRLTGTGRFPRLDGTIAARNGVLRGMPYSSIEGRMTADRSSVVVRDASLRAAGGTLSAKGDLAIGKAGLSRVDLSGAARGIPLRLLSEADLGPGRALPVPPSLASSTLSGGFRVFGALPNLRLAFDDARLQLPGGGAVLDGTLALGKAGDSRLTVELDRVPAALIDGFRWGGASPFALPSALREARVTARVLLTGPAGSLTGTADATMGPFVFPGPAGDAVVAREARGTARLADGRILLEGITLDVDGQALSGEGEIVLSRRGGARGGERGEVGAGGATIDLALAGSRLPLGRIPFLSAYARLDGFGDAAMTVRGSPGALDIAANVDSRGALVNGVPLDGLSGSFAWDGKRILLEDLVVEKGGGSLRIPSGRYNPSEKWLDIEARAFRFDADALFSLVEESPYLDTVAGESARRALTGFPVPRKGVVSGTARIAGPSDRLRGTVDVAGDGIALGQADLNELAAAGSWGPEGVAIDRLEIGAPGVHLAASGRAREPDLLDATASLSNTDLRAFVRLIDAIPVLRNSRAGGQILRAAGTFDRPISGAVDAVLTVSGRPDAPQGQMSLKGTGVVIGPQEFDEIDGLFAIQGDRFVVRRLEMTGKEAVISAEGSTGFDGDLNFDLEINNLNVAALAPLIGTSPDLRGEVDIAVEVRGTQTRPLLAASVNAYDIGTDQFRIDSIEGTGIRAAGGRLTIGKLVATRKSPELNGAPLVTEVTGSLPFSFNPIEIPDDGRIDLVATLGQQDLAVLAAIAPQTIRSVEGTVDGSVRVTGTIDRRTLSGRIRLAGGAFGLESFENRFVDLNGEVVFEGGRVALRGVRGGSSMGGTFTASGSIDQRDFPQGDANVQITARGLTLAGSNVSGSLGEQFNGRVDADIRLAGRIDRPTTSGRITALETDLTIPETAPKPTGARRLLIPIWPIFDGFEIVAGDNVRFRRGPLQTELTGTLAINGSIDLPRVTGRFALREGRVRVATKQFRIEDGSSISIAYRPPEPEPTTIGGIGGGLVYRPPETVPRIEYDIEATTRINAVSTMGIGGGSTGLNRERRSYLVTVIITGADDDPKLEFRSDPPDLTRQQILASLGYMTQIQAILQGGAEGDRAFRQGLAEAFTGALFPTVFEPIEFAIIRALGLEDFALTYDYQSPMQVHVTKRLWDKLYFTYRRQISGAGEDYDLKLFYRITPRFNVTVSTDERNIRTIGFEGRHRF